MKNKIFFVLVFVLLFSFCFKKVSASELCSPKGYTIMTINGIFTDESGAIKNERALESHFLPTYNNQPLKVDYLYNPSHLGGLGDIVDAVAQGVLDEKSDYDLTNMLSDASQKVATQKLLLVGHSQGNFYANNFYEKVADKEGGVPSESIGVYGVATPASSVAGGGKYLTSDTDVVISKVVGRVLNVLKPNTHITLQNGDDNLGHDFSGVYLKYQGDRIVSDIKSSLNNLKENDEQDSGSPCISPPEITAWHQVEGAVLASADSLVNSAKNAVVAMANGIHNVVLAVANKITGLTANVIQTQNYPSVANNMTTVPANILSVLQNGPTQKNVSSTTTKNTTSKISQPAVSAVPIATIIYSPIASPSVPYVPPVVSNNNVSNNGNSGNGNNGSGGGGSSGGTTPPATPLSSAKQITAFNFTNLNPKVIGVVNETSHTISLTVPFGTDVTALSSTITISSSASISPNNNTNFTSPVTYTVTAQNGSKQNYIVTVIIAPNPNPVPITAAPSITSYTFNSTAGDITTNPLTNPLSLVLSAGENVNWMSIKIENENDANIYKTFESDKSGCVDGTNTCAKTWDGTLSKGGPLQNGTFSVKVHIKDSANNEFYDYLTPYVINVDTTPPAPIPDTTPPVITILGDNPAVITPGSVYTDAGATALDNIDGANDAVNATGTVDTSRIGSYTITYTASDVAGNVVTATRTVTVATYKYIPEDSFGINNGDGNDWQIWSFNGSNVYDWSDTYVNNYLREQFKIQAYPGGFWCSQCLQRGIFNHDPQKGFETKDVTLSNLENNPQNNENGITYNVVLQWDPDGYTYTISHNNDNIADSAYVFSHDDVIDSTGHTDITNVNENMWVGWDGSFNNFQTFPSGYWQGKVYASPVDRIGGSGMLLQPYPVYKVAPVSTLPTLSLPNEGSYADTGIDPTRGRTNLTQFNFQTIYTDPSNNSPQNVTLHVANATTGISLPDTEMQKISSGADVLSDGSFANGELYITNGVYDTGDYNYYFTASDNEGREIRMPETGFLRFTVVPSTYTYLPKDTFGTGNGDGNNWQVWSFNGSNAYDWSDTYVNNYLREQFKIQAYPGGFWCSQCLQRGIFNHDPQKGFETKDVVLSGLENNPQNNENGITYDVNIQWDSTGYTYTISHDGIIDTNDTGHTDVPNINNNFWVGWDGSFNGFKTFPSGDWQGASGWYPSGYTGGDSMILQPYPIYSDTGNYIISPPNPPPAPLSSAKQITAFNFSGLNPEVDGVVDKTERAVSLTVPFGTDVTALTPSIIISDKASVSPNNNIAQNFTSPITYIVMAEDGSTLDYVVTVAIAPNSNPSPVVLSSDDTLSGLSVDNGALSPAFSATQTSYSVVLPAGTTAIPTVTAQTTDPNAIEVITQATSTTGLATVMVKAQDTTTTQTYTINFSVAAPINTVSQLKIITSPQTIGVNTASGIITVESQNSSGVSTKVASTTPVNLSSTSATGLFASASATTNLCDTNWTKTSVTIAKGDANKSFCYKDSASGTPTITVSTTGLTSDSQIFTVN